MNYPFPYKLTIDGNISEGILIQIPCFCTKNQSNPKCKKYYNSLKKMAHGFYKCPYGFATEKTSILGKDIYYTCLNISQKSDRKAIQRNLGRKDSDLRLTESQYEKIRNSFHELLLQSSDKFDAITTQERDNEKLESDRRLLDDTIHEIRKLNNQLKAISTRISDELEAYSNNVRLEKDNKDLYSISNLLSIRLDAYDLEVNPQLNLSSGKIDIPIFKKVEKVYKCLDSLIKEKGIYFQMVGNSYKTFSASNIIEIGLFILVENAIKYSPENDKVSVTFIESEEKLVVKFQNWGLRPNDSERKQLFERGYRGSAVSSLTNIAGRGLGLYLLNMICSEYDIKLKLTIGNDNKYIDGLRYSPFIVELTFLLK